MIPLSFFCIFISTWIVPQFLLSFLSRLPTLAPYIFAQTEGFIHLSEWIFGFRNTHARTIFVEVPDVKAKGERVFNVLAQEKACQNVLFSAVFYF